MVFLLVIPIFFVLAEAWVLWSGRTRRQPGTFETVEAHHRALEALDRVRAVPAVAPDA